MGIDFFLFSLQNIDCGYSLERVHTINVFSKHKVNITIFHLKVIIFFIAVKYCSILHGHVCVMDIKIFSKKRLHLQTTEQDFSFQIMCQIFCTCVLNCLQLVLIELNR